MSIKKKGENGDEKREWKGIKTEMRDMDTHPQRQPHLLPLMSDTMLTARSQLWKDFKSSWLYIG